MRRMRCKWSQQIQIVTIFAGLLVARTATAQAALPLPCNSGDRQCAFQAVSKHVARNSAFWKDALSEPPAKRIGRASPELIQMMALDNISQGVDEKPRAVDLDDKFALDVQNAFETLPAQMKALLSSKLAGIYFLAGLGGTGFTNAVYNDNGKPVAGFIVLDAEVLSRQVANSWATWKENTPFKPDPKFHLEAELEAAGQNTRQAAIQYIMLHELGHVVSIGENFHPPWALPPQFVPSLASYPFTSLSWRLSDDRNKYVTLFDNNFKQRTNVVYYFGAQLDAEEMVPSYSMLESTNFPTLYAATRPGDDFAESFVSYVHTVLMKRPFSIRIYVKNKIAKTFEACWDQARCREKRKILDQLFNRQ